MTFKSKLHMSTQGNSFCTAHGSWFFEKTSGQQRFAVNEPGLKFCKVITNKNASWENYNFLLPHNRKNFLR